MRIRAITIVVAALAGTVVTSPAVHAAEPNFVSVFIDASGPRGSIAVVGDSLMLGSAYEPPLVPGWGPSLARMLADRGWGPVHMAAGVGFQAGKMVPGNPGANMSLWLTNQRAQGFDPDVIVASMGPNDIIACRTSVSCAADDIRGFMDVAGPDHEVWWALQTTAIPENQTAWNEALQIVASERPNLTLWDWPSIRIAAGIPLAPDNTHLPGASQYRQRSTLIADDVTQRLGGSRPVGGAVAPPTAGTSYQYRPLPPERVIDTRSTGQRLAPGATLTVDLSVLAPTSVGADAVAAAVNVTAANPSAPGFLTVWPCGGDQPLASSVNFLAGEDRGAQATTLLHQPDRSLCVFSNAATDVIVDLQGVFVASGALRFTTVTPDRRLDTRVTGRAATIAVAAPAGAQGVAATVTVTGGSSAGFLTAYPCATTPPVVSNVNWRSNETVAGAVFVPVASDGTFCVFTSTPADVIVDITGTFSDAGTLQFAPVTPTRMVDTRVGVGGWRGHPGIGQTIEIHAAPDTATAVTGTLTIVHPGIDGYLTGTICGQPTGVTSSVNGAAGSVMANSLTVGLSPGGDLCITSSVAAHVLFDTTGWWVAAPPV
ncbi:MAG TPA: SGNH/GDSL hydrolase family protein [Ilumatobacteraceae bacterium]